MTMVEYQWCMIKARFPEVERPVANMVHVLVQCAMTQMACKWCSGENNWAACAEFHTM